MSSSMVPFDPGRLAGPVNTLIKKIADAVGVLYEPRRIVRKAKAETEAREIEAIGNLKIQELQKRALRRVLQEETRKQENIENVLRRALPAIEQAAQPEKMENDWISLFFEKIKLVSDEDIQSMWAQVLSGEANQSGSYSKASLNVLASMSKRDAVLFSNLCCFGIILGNILVFVDDLENKIYERYGINFNGLTHLDGLGLLRFDNVAGFQRLKLPKLVQIDYYGTVLNVEFPNESDNKFPFGSVLLLQPGMELGRVCDSKAEPEILSYLTSRLFERGYTIFSTMPTKVT